MRKHAFLGLLLIGSAVAPQPSRADAPPLIPVQGFLTDPDGVPIDGDHRLTFLLYDAATSGTVLYADDYTSVGVDAGHFVVYLGSQAGQELDLAVIRDASEVWIEVVVDGVETIQPRTRLGSVAYAAFAQFCDSAVSATMADSATTATSADSATTAGDATTVGGKAPSDFAASGHTHTVTGCVSVDGTCGTGTFNQPTYYLDRVAFSCPAATPLMRGWQLIRCGAIGTASEGLAVRANCCALGPPQ